MNVYQWAIQLKDMMSPALQRAQAAYGRFGQGFDRMTARLPRGMRTATQSVDQLRRSLDALKGRRDLMVDTRQIRQANREIEQLERRMNRLTGRASSGGGGLMGMVKGALPTLGLLGVMAAGGAFAKQGMDREQTKVGFEQFVGKDGVPILMKQLNRFADVTPYDNEQVYASGRSLLAAKVDPNKLTEKLTNIGNMAAVSQKGFGDLSATYAKIKAKGFIDGGELHQEFGGTALMDQLKKNLNVNGEQLFKMAEQRKIKFADVDKAIADLSKKGALYEGGLDKLSKTAGGKLSTFLGTLGNKVTEWAEKLNPFLSNLFDFGSDFLSKIGVLEGAVGNLFGAFAPLWTSLKGLMKLFGLAGNSGALLEGVINILATAINGLAFIVSAFTSPLGQMFLAVVAMYKAYSQWAVVADLVSTKIGDLKKGIQSLMTFMSANPATVWIVGLGLLVVALKAAWDNVAWFREGLIRLWAVAKAVFSGIGEAWSALLSGKGMDGITKAFADAWKKGIEAGNTAVNADRASRKKDGKPVTAKGSGLLPYKEEKEPGAGGANGTKKASGVDASVGGAKSTSITINLKSLVEHLTVNGAGVDVALDQVEPLVTDLLLRVLNSANTMS